MRVYASLCVLLAVACAASGVSATTINDVRELKCSKELDYELNSVDWVLVAYYAPWYELVLTQFVVYAGTA